MIQNQEKFIKRSIFEELRAHLSKKEISLIVGPRQVGKTTLMFSLKKELDDKGENTVFLNLDFEEDKKFFDSQRLLMDKIRLELGESGGYVFLDEIQRKENAGLFLKGIYDQGLPYKFIVSGSGSVELKEKVHESLAGRKRLFEVFPVSFLEFVNFRTNYKYENKLVDYLSLETKQVDSFLREYLNFGGYPRVILSDNAKEKKATIAEIYHSYVEKDISSLLKVEKLEAFSSLVRLLASQTGKILNFTEIANTLNLSLPTVKNYLWYLEKTYIIQKITPFFRNARKEITKSPTVYFYDIGLRNYSLGVFGNVGEFDDVGFVFQNFILNILKINQRFSGSIINFWRTKERAEVDFIVNLGKDVLPVEVKYGDLKKPAIERSLRSFVEKYRPKEALIVNKSYKDDLTIGDTKIKFTPFCELLV